MAEAAIGDATPLSARTRGLVLVPIARDGDCAFQAVLQQARARRFDENQLLSQALRESMQLPALSAQSVQYLRHLCVSAMSSNLHTVPAIVELGGQAPAQLQALLRPGEYANDFGDLVLPTLAQLLGVIIVVHYANGGAPVALLPVSLANRGAQWRAHQAGAPLTDPAQFYEHFDAFMASADAEAIRRCPVFDVIHSPNHVDGTRDGLRTHAQPQPATAVRTHLDDLFVARPLPAPATSVELVQFGVASKPIPIQRSPAVGSVPTGSVSPPWSPTCQSTMETNVTPSMWATPLARTQAEKHAIDQLHFSQERGISLNEVGGPASRGVSLAEALRVASDAMTGAVGGCELPQSLQPECMDAFPFHPPRKLCASLLQNARQQTEDDSWLMLQQSIFTQLMRAQTEAAHASAVNGAPARNLFQEQSLRLSARVHRVIELLINAQALETEAAQTEAFGDTPAAALASSPPPSPGRMSSLQSLAMPLLEHCLHLLVNLQLVVSSAHQLLYHVPVLRLFQSLRVELLTLANTILGEGQQLDHATHFSEDGANYVADLCAIIDRADQLGGDILATDTDQAHHPSDLPRDLQERYHHDYRKLSIEQCLADARRVVNAHLPHYASARSRPSFFADRAAAPEHERMPATWLDAFHRAKSAARRDPSMPSPLFTSQAWKKQLDGQPYPVIPLADLHLPSWLGDGGSCSVWKAIRRSSQRLVAVKVLRHTNSSSDRAMQVQFHSEVTITWGLRHSHIIRCLGAVVELECWAIVFETVDGEGLNRIIENMAGATRRTVPDAGMSAPPPPLLQSYESREHVFHQLCEVLHHLHSQASLIHRDIKPENVLVTRELRIKLIDFGASRVSAQHTTGSQITLPYSAPEILTGLPAPAKPAADVFAAGAILWELLHERRIPQCNHPHSARLSVRFPLNLDDAVLAQLPAGFSHLLAICRRCLEEDPKLRPTAAEILQLIHKGRQGRAAATAAASGATRHALLGAVSAQHSQAEAVQDVPRSVCPGNLMTVVVVPWYDVRRWFRRHRADVPQILATIRQNRCHIQRVGEGVEQLIKRIVVTEPNAARVVVRAQDMRELCSDAAWVDLVQLLKLTRHASTELQCRLRDLITIILSTSDGYYRPPKVASEQLSEQLSLLMEQLLTADVARDEPLCISTLELLCVLVECNGVTAAQLLAAVKAATHLPATLIDVLRAFPNNALVLRWGWWLLARIEQAQREGDAEPTVTPYILLSLLASLPRATPTSVLQLATHTVHVAMGEQGMRIREVGGRADADPANSLVQDVLASDTHIVTALFCMPLLGSVIDPADEGTGIPATDFDLQAKLLQLVLLLLAAANRSETKALCEQMLLLTDTQLDPTEPNRTGNPFSILMILLRKFRRFQQELPTQELSSSSFYLADPLFVQHCCIILNHLLRLDVITEHPDPEFVATRHGKCAQMLLGLIDFAVLRPSLLLLEQQQGCLPSFEPLQLLHDLFSSIYRVCVADHDIADGAINARQLKFRQTFIMLLDQVRQHRLNGVAVIHRALAAAHHPRYPNTQLRVCALRMLYYLYTSLPAPREGGDFRSNNLPAAASGSTELLLRLTCFQRVLSCLDSARTSLKVQYHGLRALEALVLDVLPNDMLMDNFKACVPHLLRAMAMRPLHSGVQQIAVTILLHFSNHNCTTTTDLRQHLQSFDQLVPLLLDAWSTYPLYFCRQLRSVERLYNGQVIGQMSVQLLLQLQADNLSSQDDPRGSHLWDFPLVLRILDQQGACEAVIEAAGRLLLALIALMQQSPDAAPEKSAVVFQLLLRHFAKAQQNSLGGSVLEQLADCMMQLLHRDAGADQHGTMLQTVGPADLQLLCDSLVAALMDHWSSPALAASLSGFLQLLRQRCMPPLQIRRALLAAVKEVGLLAGEQLLEALSDEDFLGRTMLVRSHLYLLSLLLLLPPRFHSAIYTPARHSQLRQALAQAQPDDSVIRDIMAAIDEAMDAIHADMQHDA